MGATDEIETLEQFDEVISRGGHLSHKVVQDLDLTGRADALTTSDVRQTIFLGCTFASGVANALRDRGALLFPALPDLPFDPYRASLYTASALFDALADGRRYADTLDARTYAWSRPKHIRRHLSASLATALHDHSISDALDDLFGGPLRQARCVGVMGGHATIRGGTDYQTAARLGATLAQAGFTVVTGGGPGSMEAANLGARFPGGDGVLSAAIETLATVPDFHPDITAWARVGLEVLVGIERSECAPTLGIPTWFYGHEPPNVFATHIAKYFSNALREDVLLQRCRAGIVVLPGAAGTVQEIFQAATGNYYATDAASVAPMVLVGRDHWTRQLPAWPLLSSLGTGRPMAPRVHIVDSASEAVDVLRG